MSLIHQALKKIESMRHGYNAPDEFTSIKEVKRATGNRSPLLAGILILALLSLGFTLYLYRSLGRWKASIAGGAHGTAVAPQANLPSEPAPDRVESTPEHNKKGVYYYRTGQLEKALEDFKAGIAESPQDGVIRNNLGLTYLSMGRFKEAEEEFKEALRLRPGYPEALNNYGALLDKEGRSEKAIELFEKSAKLDPGYADPHLNVAISLERLGRYSEAVAHYEKYLKLDSESPVREEVDKKLKRLRSGLLLKGTTGKRL